jgi:von Willebrand factor type A domain/Putative Flp pilus-assembly TadE/G-like/IPT/TIG domain
MQLRVHRVRQDPRNERGQILVLFTIVLVVILGVTALVIDLGVLRNNRQSLANAMDAGAQAGGTMMPVDGSPSRPVGAPSPADVNAVVTAAVARTYPGLQTPANYAITYKCLIGVMAGNPAAFDSGDIDAFIPLDCDPRSSHGGAMPNIADFTGAGPTRSMDCHPELGDKCNAIVLTGDVTTAYAFGRVVGVDSGNTGLVTSAACRGLCGELPDDSFDVVIVIDNSSSMGPSSPTSGSPPQTRIGWAKQAAHELLDSLEAAPGTQQVGLVKYAGRATDPDAAVELAPLSTDFDAVRTAIDSLQGDGGNTPLRQGMALGASVLTAGSRPGVTPVLIILSDGRPNPDNTSATGGRPTASDISDFQQSARQVYSIAIGAGGSGALNPDVPLMQSLAKPNDDSHFYQVINASGLPDVFRQIAVQLLNPKSHLIQVYPAPIVTAVGGGSNVSISGKYFTGAQSVTFGGASAAFTVNSDRSITATAPGGTSGDTVHVRVTTQGGSSPAVNADRYTYP